MVITNPAPDIKAQTPDELLDALLSVFSARGFDGASLQDLARACDRSKASLYHHFPGGKAQMVDILVKRCQAAIDRQAFGPLRQINLAQSALSSEKANSKKQHRPRPDPEAARTALAGFVDGFASYLQQHQGNCLLATLALTQPTLLGEQQPTQLADWLAILTHACEDTGLKPKAARRLAQASLARLYGSLTLAAMGSEVTMNQACKWLKRDLLSSTITPS